jgi:glutathione S-transferase
MRLYDYLRSGNGYKVRLVLAQLGVAYELVEKDIRRGETRTPEFLAKNPNGRIPLLELDDGRHLAESNAIISYLAEGSALVPSDRFARGEMLQWMFFEQYSHEPYIAVVRFWIHELDRRTTHVDALKEKTERGYQALDVMEKHLAGRTFFVEDRYSLADIALYAYTHVAHEGDFDLAPYAHVRAWLARVAAQPGHVTITDRPVSRR